MEQHELHMFESSFRGTENEYLLLESIKVWLISERLKYSCDLFVASLRIGNTGKIYFIKLIYTRRNQDIVTISQ